MTRSYQNLQQRVRPRPNNMADSDTTQDDAIPEAIRSLVTRRFLRKQSRNRSLDTSSFDVMSISFFKMAASFFRWAHIGDFFVLDNPAPIKSNSDQPSAVWAAVCPSPVVVMDSRWINTPVCLVFHRNEGELVVEMALERVSDLVQGKPGSYVVGNFVGTADHSMSVYNNQQDLGEIFSGLQKFTEVVSVPVLCLNSDRSIDLGGL